MQLLPVKPSISKPSPHAWLVPISSQGILMKLEMEKQALAVSNKRWQGWPSCSEGSFSVTAVSVSWIMPADSACAPEA